MLQLPRFSFRFFFGRSLTGEADMIPGAKLSYDLEINDRNGKTKAVRVKIESPGDPSGQWKGGSAGGAGGAGGGKGLGDRADS